MNHSRRSLLATAAASLTASCGYHVAGKANLMPKDLQSIGIPPFQNITTRY
jgi:outer membrane lipopolysaccharide assembly protein LptE/RlpB